MNKKFSRVVFWLMSICLGYFALFLPSRMVAQTAVSSTRNDAILNYPHDVRFVLDLPADSDVTGAALTYDVAKTSCLDAAAQVPVELTATDAGLTAEWTWVMSRSGNPPPGAELTWQWTLTHADGRTTTTSPQNLTFTDDRFDWRTVSAEGVTLHWYRGDEVGPLLLEAAVAGLDTLERDMGIDLQEDVDLYIYGSAADMRQALLYVQEWAGGVAFDEYNTILIGVAPASAASWGRSTVRHELAHLVVGQFGWSCVGGSRPTWLNEGLAVYAEGAPQPDIVASLEQAAQANSFEPLRSLNGPFSAHGAAAGIAYAQSYSIVDFLLERYGRAAMQDLLLALAAGSSTDAALEQVYGFNVDGLEQAWRAEMGLPERPFPPTPTPLSGAAVPTVAPLGKPANVPTPPAAAEPPPAVAEIPAVNSGICGFGLIPLLVVGLFFRRNWQ